MLTTDSLLQLIIQNGDNKINSGKYSIVTNT